VRGGHLWGTRPEGSIAEVLLACTTLAHRQSPPQAVETREVPRGGWEMAHALPHRFPTHRPVHTEALPIQLKPMLENVVVKHVTSRVNLGRVVLAADGKGNRPGGKVEQVAR